jgi:hypothetical protein
VLKESTDWWSTFPSRYHTYHPCRIPTADRSNGPIALDLPTMSSWGRVMNPNQVAARQTSLCESVRVFVSPLQWTGSNFGRKLPVAVAQVGVGFAAASTSVRIASRSVGALCAARYELRQHRGAVDQAFATLDDDDIPAQPEPASTATVATLSGATAEHQVNPDR